MFIDVNLATPTVSPPHKARSLEAARALIERARPDLSVESPEYQGALVLLHTRDIGLNVHRMAMRTKLPREFVARCLRRLADNACWVDGEMRISWCDDPTTCRSFWLDVEVALGRRLRRINDAGKPEWAEIGGWVKDFNYKGRQEVRAEVTNDYIEIAPHDPEPVVPQEEPEAPAGPSPNPNAVPTRLWAGRLAPPALPQQPKWLGSAEDSGDSDADSAEDSTTDGSMLVDSWTGAGWLK
ncbi:MAG TPA: hypothetical protein VFI91_02275 [Longimicrobiaceae bacterium]|nr:hypothetical protein [Longimicrobiaceae bacterium]